MTSRQGWSRADHRCGRCGDTFTATTEEEFILRLSAHELAHDLIEAATPELRRRLIDTALAVIDAQGGDAGA